MQCGLLGGLRLWRVNLGLKWRWLIEKSRARRAMGAHRANIPPWNLCNAVKFSDKPPTWDIVLTQWLCILPRWYKHPAPGLPAREVLDMHKAITSFKETGRLQHPRLNQPHPSYRKLRNPRRKKCKKEICGPAMAAAHQKVIDEHGGEGWQAIYPDGSSETHPQADMAGGLCVSWRSPGHGTMHSHRSETNKQ